MKMRMQTKRFILLTLLPVLLLLGSVPRAAAQKGPGSVTCQVSDAAGPLPGVVVRVKGQDGGAVTDLDGKAVVGGVSGPVTLVVSILGYATQELSATPGQVLGIVLK